MGDIHHPPVGTYPPDETTGAPQGIPWQPPLPPPEEKPVKKVGTLTVAIGLIAVGVLMILRLVIPSLNYIFLARLSPLLLVAYGAEVLFASAFAKDKQIKYDLVGLVVSVILIGTSLVAAALPEAFIDSREHQAAQQKLRDELDAISYEALQNAGIEVAELTWYVEPAYYNTGWSAGMTLNDLDLASDYLQVRIRFVEDFTSEEEFASACRQALDAMGVYAQNADYAIFYSHNYDTSYGNDILGITRYGLWLENNYQVNYDAGKIAREVETDYWTSYYGWMDLEDHTEYLAEFQQDTQDYDEPEYDEYDDYGDEDDEYVDEVPIDEAA